MRLVRISFTLIIVALSHIQVQADEYDKYVFRVIAAKSSSESDKISQTGFVSNKYDGIITALHGVVGRNSITAVEESEKQSFANLKITHADIANDLAVISSPSLRRKLKHKLAVSKSYRLGPLTVHGYPLGIKTQLRSDLVSLRKDRTIRFAKLFPETMTQEDREIFKLRKSPSNYAQVLALEAKLEPGHSGAPLINGEKKVVGVCIGGIKGTEISFAIPWSKISFKTNKEKSKVNSELKRLASYDVSQLMTALNQAKEDKPKYPELKMRFEEETGYFLIENKGAPMYNAVPEFNGLVSVMGYECEIEESVSITPTYFYHFVEYSQADTEFSTNFLHDFESDVSWFKKLKQKVGRINRCCLNSVELEHLVKVKYEDEAGGKHERYFSASKTFENYIHKKTNRGISKTDKIRLWEITPSEWERGLQIKKSAPEISFWRISPKHTTQARKYLHQISAALFPGVPSTPGGLKLKTE